MSQIKRELRDVLRFFPGSQQTLDPSFNQLRNHARSGPEVCCALATRHLTSSRPQPTGASPCPSFAAKQSKRGAAAAASQPTDTGTGEIDRSIDQVRRGVPRPTRGSGSVHRSANASPGARAATGAVSQNARRNAIQPPPDRGAQKRRSGWRNERVTH